MIGSKLKVMAKKDTEHSKLFNKYKDRYDRGGCTKEQLKRLVMLEAITEEEYEEITDEYYDT